MIEVIDDIIPTSLQQQIEDVILSDNFPWFYNEGTLPGFKSLNDTPQFTHTVCYEGEIFSRKMFDLIGPIFENIQGFFNWEVLVIGKAKFNLLIKRSEKLHLHPAHVDTDFSNCKSFIYYVHNTDGDTFFYDKTFNGNLHLENQGGNNILKTLTPKRGSVVVFDSNLYHCSSLPILNERRSVLNVVFKISNYNNKW